MPETLEYTKSHWIIAAGARLRDAWSMPVLDVVELHEAVLGLMRVTGTLDLASALDAFYDVESGHVS